MKKRWLRYPRCSQWSGGRLLPNYHRNTGQPHAAYTPASDVRLTPDAVCGHHCGCSLPDEQPGQHHRSLRERDFWRKGVRAVMLSQNQLYAGGEGYAWIVFSDDGDARP